MYPLHGLYLLSSPIDPPHRPANEADRNGSGTTAVLERDSPQTMGERLGKDEGRAKAERRRGKWHKYSLTSLFAVIDQFVSLSVSVRPAPAASCGIPVSAARRQKRRHSGQPEYSDDVLLATHVPPSPLLEFT